MEIKISRVSEMTRDWRCSLKKNFLRIPIVTLEKSL